MYFKTQKSQKNCFWKKFVFSKEMNTFGPYNKIQKMSVSEEFSKRRKTHFFPLEGIAENSKMGIDIRA